MSSTNESDNVLTLNGSTILIVSLFLLLKWMNKNKLELFQLDDLDVEQKENVDEHIIVGHV